MLIHKSNFLKDFNIKGRLRVFFSSSQKVRYSFKTPYFLAVLIFISIRKWPRLFEQAITYPGVGFEVVFGVSDSDWSLYDLEHGREVIGYDPQDRSEVPEEERRE